VTDWHLLELGHTASAQYHVRRRSRFVKIGAFIFGLVAASAMTASASDTIPPVDDFGSPAVLLLFLLLGAVLLVLVGIGIVVGIACLACAAIFVALGVVSSSALVALFRRRFSAGLRALHYQLSALVGLPCGVGALWLGCLLFDVHIRHRYILAIGSAIGIVAGVIIAFILDRFFRFVYRRFLTTTPPNKSLQATAAAPASCD